MKKKIRLMIYLCCLSMIMTSCYTYTMTVGNGAQTGATVQGKNHYFIGGLAQGKQTDPKELAGDIDDYTVTIQHTFVDGLVNVLTFGIYTPTTTKVQK